MIKKVLIGIGVFFLIAVVGIGYFVYQDFKEEDVLKKEVIDLSNKDFLKDNFSVSVKTKGDYAYVENAIKNYYKKLSDDIKNIYYYMNDEQFMDILSVESLEKDKPYFYNSYELLSKAKSEVGKSLDDIILLCNEDYVKNLLDKDKVSDYYIDFYRKIMCTEADLKEFSSVREKMEELSGNLNLFFDKIRDMLDMLAKNDGNWMIEDGQLYFERADLVDEYNRLYGELKDIATKIGSDDVHYDNHVSV